MTRSLRGYIPFESKRVLRVAQEKNKWEYIWGAKLINSVGVSIKENAAENKYFWGKVNMNIGFNRFEFNFKNRFSLRYKIIPVALVYNVSVFLNYDFEVRKNFQTSEFFFQVIGY